MDRGIYSAASGGLLNERHLDITANNIANASTVGFKAERIVGRQQQFADTLAANMRNIDPSARGDFDRTPGAIDIETITDFSPGPIETTGNTLDVALRKPHQFFVVSGPEGDLYTRAGNFQVDGQGLLKTADGLQVQGDGGPLALPQGHIDISSAGVVSVNRQAIGRLRVVHFENPQQLQRQAGTRFSAQNGAQPQGVDQADVIPGSLEMPNINVVEAMVDMIATQRSFEAYSKMVMSIDDLNSTALRAARSA